MKSFMEWEETRIETVFDCKIENKKKKLKENKSVVLLSACL